MIIKLNKNWSILQDVHDTGEKLGIYKNDYVFTECGAQISEWEELEELKQLQLIYAEQPYFGRELRYFNQAPWWYKKEFEVPEDAGEHCTIKFTNADYYCRVWFNETYLGEHEGYSIPFEFKVDHLVKKGEKNTLVVKVWSPWDSEVEGDNQSKRTFLISRHMVKGTYEHSDTFIQRDVNPVGLYGDVIVEFISDASFDKRPEVTYVLNEDLTKAELTVSAVVINLRDNSYTIRMLCIDKQTKEIVCDVAKSVPADGKINVSGTTGDIHLWNTWDRGAQWLYTVVVKLMHNGETVYEYSEVTGFRKIEMERNETTTAFYLNGKKLYVRGTSYFPDVYVSAMNRERYKRDLLSIKACGFNLVRVHVHVEYDIFYELCTEIGIGVIQDSEYNWTHPFDDAFADRFINVYLQTVDMLKRHPAIFCWICMNEPGVIDPDAKGELKLRAMTVNPGPALYKAVREHDPSRPAIKGSYCKDDLTSGDSHNYTGSLNGDDVHYSEIFGTTEKFNTEYGFDAPPCLDNLKKYPKIYKRYRNIEDKIDEIQYYQYALIKYYTEHYRMQKYNPNSGYVQFLFSDLCPQSYYGLFDWWGLPKAGLDAILESNMPIGVFLKYKDKLNSIYAVNDLDKEVGVCTAQWVITDGNHKVIAKSEKEINLGKDSIVKVCDLDIDVSQFESINVALLLIKDGEILAANHYEDVLNMPEHVKGHPSRMNHEFGMRLYFA